MRSWWGVCELGWGRSWLKAKAEAWAHSRPRIPCVPGELTWNHWSCSQLVLSKCWRYRSRKIHLPTSRESLITKCLSSGWSEAQVQRLCCREMLVLHCTEPELSITTPKLLVQSPPWNPQELYRCLQISTGSSTPAQEISVETVCSICPMWPLHIHGPTQQRTYSSYVFTYICIKVQWLYVWDFQILGSVLGLLLWMSGNLGQMAKSPDLREKCQTVWFLRDVWTDMERRSGVVWAVQAGGRGITPRGTLGKSSPCSGKGGWQKQKVFVRRYG